MGGWLGGWWGVRLVGVSWWLVVGVVGKLVGGMSGWRLVVGGVGGWWGVRLVVGGWWGWWLVVGGWLRCVCVAFLYNNPYYRFHF